MANPGGMRREGWREDENLKAASRTGQGENEPFDDEGQAPEAPRSSTQMQPGSGESAGPRLVPDSRDIGADYTRPAFPDGTGLRRRDAREEYGEPRPERNYPHANDMEELENTDLNPMMEAPSKPGGTLSILVLFTGALIMLILIALLFYHFAVPSPRAP